MKLILITIGILLLCVGGMAIKIWGKKGGIFNILLMFITMNIQ